MNYYRKRKPYQQKRNAGKGILALIIFLFLFMFLFSISIFADKRLMNVVTAAGEMQIKNKINKIFDESLSEYIQIKNLTSSDFFLTDSGVSSITANTLLINDLCNNVAVSISDRLTDLHNEKIRVPIGAISGIAGLANLGPNLVFSLMPVGTSEIDYDTQFVSAGINQIHFQIYLNVTTTIRIVNPIQKNDIVVCRKIALVDTIITGNVPENFYGESFPFKKNE